MVLHATAADHFMKLRRVYARLENEVHRDDLDNFFKTAYHLIENTEKDILANAAQKAAATAIRSDADIELCREITNKQKHYTLKPKSDASAKIKGASVEQGFGVGRYGAGGYGVGEQSITLQFKDGTSRDALDLVCSIMKKFEPIFPGLGQRRRIPPVAAAWTKHGLPEKFDEPADRREHQKTER